MSERIDNITSTADRYQKTNVIEHLASQFVLGTLSGLVKKRVLTLRKNNELLESRILFWQEKLVCIDEKTAEFDKWLTRIIHEFNFETILGTRPKVIYAYFAGLVTTNRSKLNQNLAKL